MSKSKTVRLVVRATFVTATAAVCLIWVPLSGATFPGANGLLVYQAQAGKHIQLFTIKPDGRGNRQITRLRDSDAINAAWSPDGRRIAFARDYGARTYGEHLDIAVINADGSGLHAFGLHGLNGEPNWSPDGRKVVWGTSGGFAIANADGSGLRKFRVAHFDGSPVYSPDGKRIAFRRSEHQGESIYVVNANGSRLKRVKAFAGGLGDKIDWSPNGSWIAYDTPSFGDTPSSKPSNIFTMRTDGTGVRQLTHGTRGQNYGLDSWSPDGKKIVFVWNVHVSGTYAIYTMNADGTHVLAVTPAASGHLAAWGTHP